MSEDLTATWQHIWRTSAPMLSRPGLEVLRLALELDDPRLLPLEPPDELLSDEPDEPWPWATKQAAQSASSAINCFFIPFVLFVCCFDRLKRHHS